MRRFVLIFLVFSVTSAAYPQTPTGAGTVVSPLPIPLPPIFSGFSNSVIDHTGNVLIFDSSYPLLITGTLTRTTTPAKTHVTVISSDGLTRNGYDYDGSMQILGVGDKAV